MLGAEAEPVSCANRILNKFLDDHQEDLLPWHESIEPCLSSIIAFINEREVSTAPAHSGAKDHGKASGTYKKKRGWN